VPPFQCPEGYEFWRCWYEFFPPGSTTSYWRALTDITNCIVEGATIHECKKPDHFEPLVTPDHDWCADEREFFRYHPVGYEPGLNFECPECYRKVCETDYYMECWRN
jgi:hypothetical protein